MNKKETIVPIAFVAISLLFVIVSAMVYLTKGKSAKWVARKMRIGALLLTLGAFSCNNSSQDEVKCYKRAEPNSIHLKNTQSTILEIKPDSSNLVEGYISSYEAMDFSFAITDSLGKTYQKGILKFDDKPKSDTKNFKLELDSKLKQGNYQLKIYTSKTENQNISELRRDYKLFIKK